MVGQTSKIRCGLERRMGLYVKNSKQKPKTKQYKSHWQVNVNALTHSNAHKQVAKSAFLSFYIY